jgi:hypothetical protein
MTYYYKAFATNEKGTAYGELQEIITHQVLLSTSPNSGKVSSVIVKDTILQAYMPTRLYQSIGIGLQQDE